MVQHLLHIQNLVTPEIWYNIRRFRRLISPLGASGSGFGIFLPPPAFSQQSCASAQKIPSNLGISSFHNHQFVPACQGAFREFRPLHLPRAFADAFGGGEHFALAESGVQGIDCLVKRRGFRLHVRREQVHLAGGTDFFKAEEHDACLAVARSGQEERRHFWTDCIEHCVRRICRCGEHDCPHDAVPASAGTEYLSVDVAACRKHIVLSELRRCTACREVRSPFAEALRRQRSG